MDPTVSRRGSWVGKYVWRASTTRQASPVHPGVYNMELFTLTRVIASIEGLCRFACPTRKSQLVHDKLIEDGGCKTKVALHPSGWQLLNAVKDRRPVKIQRIL